jgi:MFS family permease
MVRLECCRLHFSLSHILTDNPSICEFLVAIVGTVAPDSTAAGYVLVVFICIYIAFFTSTWGPVSWVIIGEIFPLPIRAKGVGLSTASNWFWNFIIGYITPYMVDSNAGNLGAKVFFIWGSTCTLCVLFAYFFVPETKGLSLEQIDKMMEECSPRQSRTWVPSSTFTDDLGLSKSADGLLPGKAA